MRARGAGGGRVSCAVQIVGVRVHMRIGLHPMCSNNMLMCARASFVGMALAVAVAAQNL